MAIIEEGRGRHFDPDVLDAFVQAQFVCKEIAENHANEE
jgi:HD-GYP domain-containing protein (c-di-GMP phosphodiesterase class II)